MINAIARRQSIRRYTNQKISHEQLVQLLNAGFRAPTARNKQPYHFLVVENGDIAKKIQEGSNTFGPFKEAEAAILVSYDKTIEDREAFGYVDTAAAIENILLEACEMGLGTCWCAVAPIEEREKFIKDFFKLSDNLVPVGIISIGYPNETKPIEERYDEEKIIWVK